VGAVGAVVRRHVGKTPWASMVCQCPRPWTAACSVSRPESVLTDCRVGDRDTSVSAGVCRDCDVADGFRYDDDVTVRQPEQVTLPPAGFCTMTL